MWIKVKSQDGLNINLPVPLSVIGARLLVKIAAKHGGPEAEQYAPLAADMVRELRRYVRKNGHFVLVDVKDHEGTMVKISV
ncbi:MAG: hypothetical protein II164_02645 [Firmicutes bacterium]|nr:hypothetical protein [Bacillota bacterium]MBQ1891224.1 hypothetical protein [Bacillota bacterium]